MPRADANLTVKPPIPKCILVSLRGYTLEEIQQGVFADRLEQFGNDRPAAARSLEVHTRTVKRKMRRWATREKRETKQAGDKKSTTTGPNRD